MRRLKRRKALRAEHKAQRTEAKKIMASIRAEQARVATETPQPEPRMSWWQRTLARFRIRI